MPISTINGSAVTAALIALLMTGKLTLSAFVYAAVALITISPGPLGETSRTVGDLIYDTLVRVGDLSEKIGVTDVVAGQLARLEYGAKMEKIRRVETEVQQVLQQAEETLSGADNQMTEIQSFQSDVKGVLQEADAAISQAIQIQEDKIRLADEDRDDANLQKKAMKAEAKMEQLAQEAKELARAAREAAKNYPVDLKVPYDAAARLAYGKTNKRMKYENFKSKFEANAVADVIGKNEAKRAEADRASEEAKSEKERAAAVAAATAAAAAEEQRLADEEEEAGGFSDADWDASVDMAKSNADGIIVGMDDAETDISGKADWDAAGKFAQTLSGGQKEDDESPVFGDEEPTDIGIDDEGDDIDIEALARAAREAVEKFEELAEDTGSDAEDEESDDDDDFVSMFGDDDEISMDDIAAAARKAASLFNDDDDGDGEISMDDVARKAGALFGDEDSDMGMFFADSDSDEEAEKSESSVPLTDWSKLKVVELKGRTEKAGITHLW